MDTVDTDLNIDTLIAMLESDSESDFHFARELIYEHWIINENEKCLKELTNKLIKSNLWIYSDYYSNPRTLCRNFEGVTYNYYDYNEYYGKGTDNKDLFFYINNK